MADEKKEYPQYGHKIIGTVKSVKGTCSAGHKVGDQIELSFYTSGGLCGVFYHDLFPWLVMMQLGGNYPWSEDKDVAEFKCMDSWNEVTLELRRVRQP